MVLGLEIVIKVAKLFQIIVSGEVAEKSDMDD